MSPLLFLACSKTISTPNPCFHLSDITNSSNCLGQHLVLADRMHGSELHLCCCTLCLILPLMLTAVLLDAWSSRLNFILLLADPVSLSLTNQSVWDQLSGLSSWVVYSASDWSVSWLWHLSAVQQLCRCHLSGLSFLGKEWSRHFKMNGIIYPFPEKL